MAKRPTTKRKRPIARWILAGTLAVLLVVAAGYYIYTSYIYKAPPIYARIDTSKGPIEVELYPACAPKTVANFVNLAELGFYNDLAWHRIVKTSTFWIIQTGDPNSRGGLNSTRPTWGMGGSNQTVPLEAGTCQSLGNYAGYIGMARQGNQTTGQDSGTSQFYINVASLSDNAGLNGYYTVFGRVISGMSVVVALGDSPTCQPPTCPSTWQANEPLPAVFVNNIVILGTNASATNSTSS